MTTLNNQEILPIGFGTWKMGGTHIKDTTNDTQEIAAIRYALQQGITFINGAEVYGDGHTDELIGEAAKGFNSAILASKLKRETLMAPETIEERTRAIAQRLGRPTIDLLYVHWAFPDADMREYLPAMFALVDKGLVRAIGVSNFDLEQLKRAQKIAEGLGHRISAIENVYSLLNRGGAIHPAVNLIQPGFDADLQEYCRANDILMVAYTPTYKGNVRDNLIVQKIASSHEATPIQVALAWHIHQGIVPIVKSSQPTHIDENLSALKVKLTAQEMEELNAIVPEL